MKIKKDLANWFLTVSDVVILGSSNFLVPVFAIFVIERVNGGNLAVVGFASATYFAAKGLVQVPIARITDRIRGEYDDYLFMLFGTFAASLLPLGYLFISETWQLYLMQALIGVSYGAAYPTYAAIFTRHIEREKENMTWGIRFSLLDFANIFTAAAGGLVAMRFGFPTLVLVHVSMSLIGSCLLLPARRFMR